MTLLRAEAREQRAILVVVLSAALTWLAMRQAVSLTVPQWVDWIRGTTYSLLLLPAPVAFIAVWTGGRDRATGLDELRVRSVRSAWRTHGLSLGVAVGSVVAGWTLALVVRAGIYLARGAGGLDSLNPLVLLVAVCWLVAVAGTGYAIGRLPIPRWVAAPVVAVIVFGLPMALSVLSYGFESALPIPFDIWTAQGRWNWPVVSRGVLMSVAAAGVGLGCYLIACRLTVAKVITTAALTGVVLVAGWSNFDTASWRALPDADALVPLSTLTCVQEGAVRVCVHPAHAPVLADVPERLRASGAETTTGPGVTLRIDLGFGASPRSLDDGVIGAGLDVLDLQPTIPDCHLETAIDVARGGRVPDGGAPCPGG